ncbi:MAG: chemotaxis protein MotB [Hyphomicrobiales bacterium]|nr:MAG: chemotaxis protein MotB [Hyphomicrobiales bacterium]
MANFDQPIIIKRVKKTAHAHHGGAWKIAYADFVTAMMAFFLLLWLISMTTPEQKKGLADYFAPASVSETNSGAGGVLAGKSFDTAGAKTTDSNVDAVPGVATSTRQPGMATLDASTGEQGTDINGEMRQNLASNEDIRSKFDAEFQAAAASIQQAWQAMPDISTISENLIIEETPEGLNIVIMDQAGRPMFPEGSRYPFEITRRAIAALAPTLQRLPNQITISGHTASGSKYDDPNYGAWELSSDRATTVRGLLGEFGVPEDHFNSVNGRATSDPLFPNDPYLSGNGRVEITLMHASPPVPPGFAY